MEGVIVKNYMGILIIRMLPIVVQLKEELTSVSSRCQFIVTAAKCRTRSRELSGWMAD